MPRFPIGQRIRHHRLERGLAQSALAKQAGISPAYLNLIEHDKRMIGGALLGRIAQSIGVPLNALDGSEEQPLAQEVRALARSHALPGLDDAEALRMVARNPGWARALLALHRKYRGASELALALSDRLGQDPSLMALSHAILTRITAIRSFAEILEAYPDLGPEKRQRFSGIIASQGDRLGSDARTMIDLLSGGAETPQALSPEREVDDFLILHRNHFPAIEEAAEGLSRRLPKKSRSLSGAIADRLTRKHGVRISYDGASHKNAPSGDAADRQLGPALHLRLDGGVPESTQRFRVARQLALLEFGTLLDTLVDDERLTTDTARARARTALANYAAAALLLPYAPFLEAAETERYDIERLGARFRCSIEQTAHRLVTLRRDGAEGIPFAFLRTDPAGNISKPFSIPGLRMPRFGSACPRWAIYEALSSPERTVAQLAAMPEGGRFLFIARHVAKRVTGFRAPAVTYGIMLGCDAAYAERTVYGDIFAAGGEGLATPTGFNCRTCTRSDCGQRAHAAILSGKPEEGRDGQEGSREDGREEPTAR